jgi:SAM-dependent methyltransferase
MAGAPPYTTQAVQDPTTRFDDRVDDYVRNRPGYPPEAIGLLRRECGLGAGCDVADIGSGTGKLTELLLAAVARVFAVEPGAGMRAAAERLLGRTPGFVSVNGRAEATGLPNASVDLVTAAQAFHWFDQAACRVEFLRILRPRGLVALLWNEQDEAGSAFQQEYRDFLGRFSVDYAEVDHRHTASRERITAFFGSGGVREAEFPNHQELDLEGLRGRYLSCSYALSREASRYPEAMTALAEIFRRHQRDGRVRMVYWTRMYHGRPG